MALQKILRTGVRRVRGNVAFLRRFGPFFYDERKAGQDVYFNFNALLYF